MDYEIGTAIFETTKKDKMVFLFPAKCRPTRRTVLLKREDIHNESYEGLAERIASLFNHIFPLTLRQSWCEQDDVNCVKISSCFSHQTKFRIK